MRINEGLVFNYRHARKRVCLEYCEIALFLFLATTPPRIKVYICGLAIPSPANAAGYIKNREIRLRDLIVVGKDEFSRQCFPHLSTFSAPRTLLHKCEKKCLSSVQNTVDYYRVNCPLKMANNLLPCKSVSILLVIVFAWATANDIDALVAQVHPRVSHFISIHLLFQFVKNSINFLSHK